MSNYLATRWSAPSQLDTPEDAASPDSFSQALEEIFEILEGDVSSWNVI
jgi:hypothetical protein